MSFEYVMVGILFYVVIGVVWGAITSSLMRNKGYTNTTPWFICGVIFWFIGLIIAAVQPNLRMINAINNNQNSVNTNQNNPYVNQNNQYADYSSIMWNCCICGTKNMPNALYCARCGQESPEPVGNQWRCSCGTVNQPNTDYCLFCGNPKSY